MVQIHEDRIGCAEQAGLRYVDDREPGVRRVRCGRGFAYRWPDGTLVTGADRLRCESLVIPPAWTQVWICATDDGHIQAVGRDARGRKQYRYHAEWQALRQMMKYDRLLLFGETLPTLRERVQADLSLRRLPQEKVLAAVVELMGRTMIRVGNAEYARDNESFGLTTLRGDHVEVEGSRLRFGFRGKSGKMHEVSLADRRLARIVRQCQELHGQELFAWTDGEGRVRDVRSEDVNQYLRSISDQDYTAKEFRTWGGSVRAFRSLREAGPSDTRADRKRAVTRCIKQVAQNLGNTPTVCRAYYVHPVVLEAYEDGRLFSVEVPPEPTDGLGRSEHGLLSLLRAASTKDVA
jgi:DNA topoisomerase-1